MEGGGGEEKRPHCPELWRIQTSFKGKVGKRVKSERGVRANTRPRSSVLDEGGDPKVLASMVFS